LEIPLIWIDNVLKWLEKDIEHYRKAIKILENELLIENLKDGKNSEKLNLIKQLIELRLNILNKLNQVRDLLNEVKKLSDFEDMICDTLENLENNT